MNSYPLPSVTPERFRQLALLGFVHVTGLVQVGRDGKPVGNPIGSELDPSDYGSVSEHGGLLAIITNDGQVWICNRALHAWRDFTRRCELKTAETLKAVTGMERSNRRLLVPFTKGRCIPAHDLLSRLMDPNAPQRQGPFIVDGFVE